MNTMTTTTASAVSRFLASKGFDKYDRWNEFGYSVFRDGNTIRVANHGFATGTAAVELAAAGYVVEALQRSESAFTGRHMETFVVAGKVAA